MNESPTGINAPLRAVGKEIKFETHNKPLKSIGKILIFEDTPHTPFRPLRSIGKEIVFPEIPTHTKSTPVRGILERLSNAAKSITHPAEKAKTKSKDKYDPKRRELFKKLAGAGVAVIVTAAIPETRVLTVGVLESAIQSLLTRHPQIGPLKEAGEVVLTKDGIPYCNKVGENLYSIIKQDFPKVFIQPPETIQPITEEIQPSDHLRYPDVPPNQLEFYAKESPISDERMSDGIARLFLSGTFAFKTASEPLTLSEIDAEAKKLNKAIRTHLLKTGKGTGSVYDLNPGKKVANALVTNELAMREIVEYYLRTAGSSAPIEPLSPYIFINGKDTDQQKEQAVARRQAYFLELGYRNRDNPRSQEFADWKKEYIGNKYNVDKYMWLVGTLRNAVMSGSSLKDILAKSKLADQLTDSLLQLDRDGLINIDMLTRMDPEMTKTLINKLEKTKLPKKSTLPGSLFAVGFGTVAAQAEDQFNQPSEEVLTEKKSLFKGVRKWSRRAFLGGVGLTAATIAVTGSELVKLQADPPKELGWIDRRDWQNFLRKAPRLTRPDIGEDFEGSSKIFYSNGIDPLPGPNRFSKGQIRETCSLSEMPPFLLQAVAASEDARMDMHSGVDPVGLARGFISGGSEGGGSTIAMQLVKHVFDNVDARTGRTKDDIHLKVEEALGAWFLVQFRRDQARVALEQMGKAATETQVNGIANDSILADYLNTINYGTNIAGIKTASQTFFNLPPNKLSKAQQLFLVGIPQGPNESDPRRYDDTTGKELEDHRVVLFPTHPGVVRFLAVLNTIESKGLITTQEAADMRQKMIKDGGFIIEAPRDTKTSAALEYTILQLNNVPDSQIARRPNTVVTTFDRQINEQVEAIAAKALETTLKKNYGVNYVDVVVRDPDGRLVAAFGRPSFTHAVGSVAKVVTTAVALEEGATPDTKLDNSPLTIRLPPPEKEFTTSNFDPTSSDRSPTPTLTEALKLSYNNTFVREMTRHGVVPFIDMWERVGLSDHMDTADIGRMSYLSTLGANPESNANRISTAMNTLANEGRMFGGAAIRAIKTADGKLLYSHDPKRSAQQVVDPRVGRMFMQMLEDEHYQLNALKSDDNRYAAKTGTSSNSKEGEGPYNGWCAGFVKGKDGKRYQITVVAYNFDGTYDQALKEGATGEKTAVPIYRDIADFIHDRYQP